MLITMFLCQPEYMGLYCIPNQNTYLYLHKYTPQCYINVTYIHIHVNCKLICDCIREELLVPLYIYMNVYIYTQNMYIYVHVCMRTYMTKQTTSATHVVCVPPGSKESTDRGHCTNVEVLRSGW